MINLEPADRTQNGLLQQAQILASAAPPPRTVFESTWGDYVFGEVWARPALDRRSRYLIAIAAAACAGSNSMLDQYIYGALSQGDITVPELREAVLQLAVYSGWPRGAVFDAAVTRTAESLNMSMSPYKPICAESWSPDERRARGREKFASIMTMCPSESVAATPFLGIGSLNFVFSEMWTRPGLDQRARRWITLVGVADSSANTPILTHVYAAMATNDATEEEMHEFALQYALYGGWPKASLVHAAIVQMAERVKNEAPHLMQVGIK